MKKTVLVVVKNKREFEFEMREWRRRCETAVRQIGELGDGKLEEVFVEGDGGGEAGREEFSQMMEGLRKGTK